MVVRSNALLAITAFCALLRSTMVDYLNDNKLSSMFFINTILDTPFFSQYHRTTSPGLILREYKNQGYEDVARIYTYSYLTEEPGYLRRPIEPYDRAPVSPHFHRPVQQYSTMSSGTRSGSGSRSHSRSRSAMKVLVDSIRSETPRPKSPGMNNEEPIELSHYPAAKKPPPGEKPKIERDDFPAPPYPYTDPERRRRYSDSYKGVPESDDEVDHAANNKENVTDK